jgi:hypothetical protein
MCTVGMLTLYRRHTKDCKVHTTKLPSRAKRRYMDSDCPLWMYGNAEDGHLPRQSTGTTDLAVAEALRLSLLKKSQDQVVHGPMIEDCIDWFLASREVFRSEFRRAVLPRFHFSKPRSGGYVKRNFPNPSVRYQHTNRAHIDTRFAAFAQTRIHMESIGCD